MRTRPGLADRVVAQLLAAVAEGTHPPGTRLPPEAELAAAVRVSRLTLREAVRVLRDKGVLRVEQGRGTFVNPPEAWAVLDPALLSSRAVLSGDAAQTAQQITETRRIVEVGAAQLAARRRTPAHMEHLEATVRRMQAAHEAGDVPEFSAADVEFHDGVMLAAGNPFLAALLQPIKALVREVREHTSLAPDMRVTAVAAHTAILGAIRDGDVAAAELAMSEHMAETHRVIERLVDSGGFTLRSAARVEPVVSELEVS